MRKAFRRRIRGLSLAGGAAIGVILLLALSAQRFASVYQELESKNQLTLGKIRCDGPNNPLPTSGAAGRTCDISAVEEDESLYPADYVLDRRTRYFMYNSADWPRFQLNFSDVSFIRRFRQPRSD